jgi:Fe-S oxidoreductase
LHAATRVLEAAGWRVHVARPARGALGGGRPLCCGRGWLDAGAIDEARAEARRTVEALMPFVERGIDIVGLEPACLLTLRDEYLKLGLGEPAERLARHALLFEEFVAREHAAGRFDPALGAVRFRRALVHPHCHQRAFGAVSPMVEVLALVPGLEVQVLDAGCCGMSGPFGYEAEHFDLSVRMAELALLPAVRDAAEDTVILADGSGCRHQIRDGAARGAMHVATLLAEALDAALPGRAKAPADRS